MVLKRQTHDQAIAGGNALEVERTSTVPASACFV
jgi:hypothetical protein